MGFIDKLAAFLPTYKKEEVIEYFFALNIGLEKLTAALWAIDNKELKILQTASDSYSSQSEIIATTDRLLDAVLGISEIEPQKILFGVPNSWLVDDNLKDDHLKLLRDLVKELELSPLAYVSSSNAVIHLLEKREGVPTTAILVGFEIHHLTVTVVRAGKLDGVKIIVRGDSSGTDIEKALLAFTAVETLPSKILIYGLDQQELGQLKNQLLSFPWMSNLNFLHLPKIDILSDEVEIKSVCLAGATELNSAVYYKEAPVKQTAAKSKIIEEEQKEEEIEKGEDFGFVVGDVSEGEQEQEEASSAEAMDKRGFKDSLPQDEETDQQELALPEQSNLLEVDDFNKEATPALPKKRWFHPGKFFPKTSFLNLTVILGVIGALAIVIGAVLFLPKAEIKIFVEPRVLEKDTQVTADPTRKEVDEAGKIIPGQIVDTEVAGSAKDSTTGKKQVGDAARGTVKIINNTDEGRSFSKGTTLTTADGLKFTLDNTASVSATPSDADSKSTKNVEVTAIQVGADGNLPSGTNLTFPNIPTSQIVAKSEGNFSGGTSREVSVVSDTDQKRLLASLASELRRQAQQKLQEKLPDKKILEEALAEEVIKKSYSKNIGDQASEFSLNLNLRYRGTAFEEKDLRLIVSKLVDTQVPQGFELNLSETETQSDVSKLEKDGKLIFLARFKAKLVPKIDTEQIKKQIRGKSPAEVAEQLKQMENVLGSEIRIKPNLPSLLQRIPIISQNIKIEVGLK